MHDNDKFIQCTVSEAEDIVFDLWKTWLAGGPAVAVNLEAIPGVGKTSTGRRLAKRMAKHLSRDVTDSMTPSQSQFGLQVSQFGNKSEEVIAGLPYADKEADPPMQLRAMATDFPRSGMGLWIIDEFAQVPYAWRFVAQIITDGCIGKDYVKPLEWFLLLMGNGAKDRAGAMRIPTHLQNRMLTLKVVPSVQGALDNFHFAPATPEISVYLRWFGESHDIGGKKLPGKLALFDAREDGPWPSPRTWDLANAYVSRGMDPIKHFVVFQGLLGFKTALDLKSFWNAVSDLPNVDEMLANPEQFSTTIETMHQKDPTKTAALAMLVLKRLDRDRDVQAAGKAIRLFRYAALEAVAAYVHVADTIDKRHNDGRKTLDHPEYARLITDFPQVFVQ